MATDSTPRSHWRRLRERVRARQRRAKLRRRWPIDRARRALALALLVTGVALALAPHDASAGSTRRVVVAGHDLAAGARLRASDVHVVSMPAAVASEGTLSDVRHAAGRRLSGAVRSGEPVTDVRLLGNEHDVGQAGMSAVPIRLDDSAVADVLTPGMRVDVVTVADASNHGDRRTVLARNATVIAVTDAGDRVDAGQRHGRLVMIAMDEHRATFVASASLQKPVTVTLR